MTKIFSKEGFARLTKEEKAELMWLQMSPSWGGSNGYLPDDCSECGACGQPMMGVGWCPYCSNRFTKLANKAKGSER